MHTQTLPYPWTVTDLIDLERSSGFGCIAEVALRVISRFSTQVVMVSGPMTTGGKGSLEENLKAYKNAVAFLQGQGLPAFNQLLAEEAFKRHWYAWKARNPEKDYCWPILREFYEPVFRSRRVRGLYFMPGWQTSKGCREERRLALDIPLEITDLPLDWEGQFAAIAV